MDPRLAVWMDLRAETLLHIAQFNYWLMFIPTLMLVLIGLSRLDRFKDALLVAMIFGAFAPSLVARQDLLLHRPAPAVKAIETELGICGWENCYKPKLARINRLLIPLDFLAAMPIVVLFFYSVYNSWKRKHRILAGVCVISFLGGIAFIFYVLRVANQLMQTI